MTNITGSRNYPNLEKAFVMNFADHAETGAAAAVFRDGQLDLSMWGGYADADQNIPWDEGTLVNVWSTTKGICSACVAQLIDRGVLDYNTKFSDYMEAFRTESKREITLGMVLSHQSGMCGFPNSMNVEDLYDLESAVDMLTSLEPLWTPGTAHGYHALSGMMLVSALLKQVYGKTLKQHINDELLENWGLDIYIGLPDHLRERVATILDPAAVSSEDVVDNLSEIQASALQNPLLTPAVANTRGWQSAEIPSANGFATAKALAGIYGALANGGKFGDRRFLSEPTLAEASRARTPVRSDLVLGVETQWANGFWLNNLGFYGPNPQSFGHSGWGGSFAFADPNTGIGFAYTMNYMGTQLIGGPRAMALVNALYRDISEV